jgi:hypothetical protein
MADALTSITELLVGVACLGLGWAFWRRGGPARWVAAALVIAGLAAAANAIVSLAQ